jgi:hypothetical protein
MIEGSVTDRHYIAEIVPNKKRFTKTGIKMAIYLP